MRPDHPKDAGQNLDGGTGTVGTIPGLQMQGRLGSALPQAALWLISSIWMKGGPVRAHKSPGRAGAGSEHRRLVVAAVRTGDDFHTMPRRIHKVHAQATVVSVGGCQDNGSAKITV